MHPVFHEEIARSRQADFLREAKAAHLASEARQNRDGVSWRERLGTLTAQMARRRTRATRLVVRAAQ
jgi:hypothetical protein